jgi:hypothetical protein
MTQAPALCESDPIEHDSGCCNVEHRLGRLNPELVVFAEPSIVPAVQSHDPGQPGDLERRVLPLDDPNFVNGARRRALYIHKDRSVYLHLSREEGPRAQIR